MPRIPMKLREISSITRNISERAKSAVWRRHFSEIAVRSQQTPYFSTKLREIPRATRNRQFGDGISRIPMKLRGKLLTTSNLQFGDGPSRIPRENCAKYHGRREIRSLGMAFLVLLNEIA